MGKLEFVENATKKSKRMTLQQKFNQELIKTLQTELKLDNVMAVPRLAKVTINVGAKEAMTDKKVLEAILEQIGTIAGQKPSVRLSKKSIANFKLREGLPIGVCVTLRGKRMFEFVEKLIKIVFPRVRDFRGVPLTSFDGRGNYSLGFKEQIVFPEIDYSKIDKIRGLEITITTTAKNDEEGTALLKALGMPFEKR